MNLVTIILLFFSIFCILLPKAHARGGYHHILKFIDCKEITDIKNEIDQDKKIIRADRVVLQGDKRFRSKDNVKKYTEKLKNDILIYKKHEQNLDKCITYHYE
jgi:hypothetical protein